MESLVLSSSSSSSITAFLEKNRNFCLLLQNGYSSSLSFSSQNFPFTSRKSVIVAAKKNDSSKKREDTHPFVAKPNEAYGFYPEAVLDKEKKIQEDGKLLPDFADAEEKELYEALTLRLEERLAVEQMRHYEVVYLIHEKFKDEVENVNLKIQDFLREKKARIWNFSDWGLRKLAYKIAKAKNAHYILMNFEIDSKWINDFKSMLDKDERVIRHLVMKTKEAVTEERPPPPEFVTGDDDIIDIEYIDEDNDDEVEYEYYEYEDEVVDDENEIDATNIDDDDDSNIIYVDEDEDMTDEGEDQKHEVDEDDGMGDEGEDERHEIARVKGGGRRRLKGGGRRKLKAKKVSE